MQEYTINLNTIEKVKDFSNATNVLSCDIRLVSGRYAIDGKSILGIFSLDLSKNILMQLTGSNEEINKAIDVLGRFMV